MHVLRQQYTQDIVMAVGGFLVVLSLLMLWWLPGIDAYTYRSLGKFNIPHPSFVEVLTCKDGTSPSLWITEFSPLTSGKVSGVQNITALYPDFSKTDPVVVSDSFLWPNEVSRAPDELGDYLVVCDGFLVPLKSTGGVYMLETNCTGPLQMANRVELTTPKTSWFYHMTQWRDMNGDGKLDLITTRATKPIIGSAAGQLLWLEQPQVNPLQNVPWKEHVLADGPDVIFTVADLNTSDEVFEVFAAEFFSKKLSVLTVSSTNSSVMGSRDIDVTLGAADCVSVVDLNADGTKDLLVSNHEGDAGGSVYGYEIPQDVLGGSYTRYQIATDFPVTEKGFNQASPGFVYAFRPNANYTGKPYILVAGDGSQKAYLLQPTDQDFAYNRTEVLAVNGVVGTVGIGEGIGPDGWTEFFVPDYDEGIVYAYIFSD